MNILNATNAAQWDQFLASQPYRPFLQSWAMGEVYKDLKQEPIRLVIEKEGKIVGICFGHVVDAKRGKHLSVPYGPVLERGIWNVERGRENSDSTFNVLRSIILALSDIARSHGCSFIRISPFLSQHDGKEFSSILRKHGITVLPSPLHLLAEHIWYLPLMNPDPWNPRSDIIPWERSSDVTPWERSSDAASLLREEELFKKFRATHRNLIRRAEKEGVTVEASKDPHTDLDHFIRLHDETRKRHGFTAYTNTFFRAQVKHFSAINQCTVYLARYKDEVISSSIHIHAFGETSYHHGASSSAHSKIPASHLLQWQAIQDAIARGDQVYNFWGIAPQNQELGMKNQEKKPNPESRLPAEALAKAGIPNPAHPFAGVTLFKTGFGGQILNLMHCVDIPLSKKYYLTRGFEMVRKWRRGF